MEDEKEDWHMVEENEDLQDEEKPRDTKPKDTEEKAEDTPQEVEGVDDTDSIKEGDTDKYGI